MTSFLVDQQLPKALATFMAERGHDARHIKEYDGGTTMPDLDIARLADSEDRFVVTKDDDFRISHLLGKPPARLLHVTCGNITTRDLLTLFGEHRSELDAKPSTGVPEGQFNAEEIRGWVRGQAKLTTEDLARYWKDEYFNAVSQIRYYEGLLLQYADGRDGNTVHRGTYEQRLAAAGARRDEARLRLLALDPDALPAPRDDAAEGWA